MSTNYYAITPDTPEGDEGLHIGKHSDGWEFIWRGYEDLSLTSVGQWGYFLDYPHVTIVTEAGAEVSHPEFMTHAVRRPADAIDAGERMQCHRVAHGEQHRWRDASGNYFVDYEFC